MQSELVFTIKLDEAVWTSLVLMGEMVLKHTKAVKLAVTTIAEHPLVPNAKLWMTNLFVPRRGLERDKFDITGKILELSHYLL